MIASNSNKTWDPIVGLTTKRFVTDIDFLDDDGRKKLIEDSRKILSRCAEPSELSGNRSIVVVGEVQSGKTLSFTTVTSLARDNNFQAIVLLAGTKKNLLNQTHERLIKDLGIESHAGGTEWTVIKSPKVNSKSSLIKSLETWNDPHLPNQFRETTILVVLKSEAGIRHVTNLLSSTQSELGRNLPVLIIDDEADQASLNVSLKADERSATYAAVTSLRESLPNHSYVMYTATAQALLLLDFEDHLSPDSVVVLESGPTYIGGKTLFGDRSSRFFREIPLEEIPSATAPEPLDPAPKSLQKALAYYFVALCVAQERRSPKPLSMLIHPAATKQIHDKYRNWVLDIISRWSLQLEDMDEGGFQATIDRDLKPAISELQATCDVANVFPEVSEADLPSHIGLLVRYWIKKVEIRVVNSESQANEIGPKEWVEKPGWIVIGGQKLERGFTIENLAVTYMPRGSGIRAADTIQQRGRFFGHKAKYSDLLRGWMNSDTRESFYSIVEFEDAMRKELTSLDETNQSLHGWRRELILGNGMLATRKAVISLSHETIDLKSGFRFKQDHLYFEPLGAMFDETMDRIRSYHSSSEVSHLDTRNRKSLHTRANISITHLVELLVDWPMTRQDRSVLDQLLVALKYYGDFQPNMDAHLYFMDDLEPRRRSLMKKNESSSLEKRYWRTINLHQGGSPEDGPYIGDSNILTQDAVTVQIHNVIPRHDGFEYPAVLALAIAWPEGFRRTILRQST